MISLIFPRIAVTSTIQNHYMSCRLLFGETEMSVEVHRSTELSSVFKSSGLQEAFHFR